MQINPKAQQFNEAILFILEQLAKGEPVTVRDFDVEDLALLIGIIPSFRKYVEDGQTEAAIQWGFEQNLKSKIKRIK